jgi:hypothetical protein
LPADLFGENGSVKQCDVVDFREENQSRRKWKVEWPMNRAGESFGFVLFNGYRVKAQILKTS